MLSKMKEDELLGQLATRLLKTKTSFATAESCTGGLIAAAATSIPGSSRWFERGYVTYSNQAKTEALGVDRALIESSGAVSEACAKAMAEGCLLHSHAGFAISVTGIAGPDGGSPAKPVGTVCFGWAAKGRETRVETCRFAGDRAEVRRQSVLTALDGLLSFIDEANK
jgi:nicotinamide-nucleotide amidase